MLLRSYVCTAVAVLVFAGFSLAGDETKKKKKKTAPGISGEIAKIDAEKGTITLKVQIKKKQSLDKEYKVTDKTTVTAVDGETKTELKADKVVELLKKEQFKTGTTATIEPDGDGSTAKAITLGQAPVKKKKKKDDQ